MKKYAKLIFAIVFLCVGIVIMFVINLLSVDLNKITQQRGYIITNQMEKSIEVTIDKKELPTNIDFTQGISFAKDDIILYQTDTSNMYLKSIQYANLDTEYLSLTFDFDYVLPEEAKIIVPYDVLIKDNKISYSWSVVPNSKQVKDKYKVFDDAISLHGSGPSEQFSIYLKTYVFTEAQDEISFTIDGFNELSYIKK